MDQTFLTIIILIIAIFCMIIFYIALQTQFKKLRERDSIDDKKDEILTKWLENMNTTVTQVQNLMDTRLKDVQHTFHTQLNTFQTQMNQTTTTLNARLDETTKTLNTSLGTTTKSLNERLDNAARVIGEVKEGLGSMNEIGRNMKDLQDFLKSPKLRGNIGEQILTDLLSEMLPKDRFELQYTFSSGEKVDALIKVGDLFVSVDSKLPMENFNQMLKVEKPENRESYKKEFQKNVKKHIDDISKKYILESENTLDFAFMYIASESIYYEIVVNNEELETYARAKKIIPVSPNVFYSYLKAIQMGIKREKLESKTKDLIVLMSKVKDETNKLGRDLELLTENIRRASIKLEDVNNRHGRIVTKLEKAEDDNSEAIPSQQQSLIS